MLQMNQFACSVHDGMMLASMHVAVDFAWREVGSIRVEAGRLRFPEVPDAPGVYRFDLGQTVYIGEADRLRRRFQHYRTPGPTQATNIRLNALMLRLLGEGGAVTVCAVTTATVEVDGHQRPLDLREKAARLLVENAALNAARLTGGSWRTSKDSRAQARTFL